MHFLTFGWLSCIAFFSSSLLVVLLVVYTLWLLIHRSASFGNVGRWDEMSWRVETDSRQKHRKGRWWSSERCEDERFSLWICLHILSPPQLSALRMIVKECNKKIMALSFLAKCCQCYTLSMLAILLACTILSSLLPADHASCHVIFPFINTRKCRGPWKRI